MNETALASAGSDELFRKTLAFCGYTGYAAIILFIIGGVWQYRITSARTYTLSRSEANRISVRCFAF